MRPSRRRFVAGATALSGITVSFPAHRLLAAEERLRLTIGASHQLSDPPVGPLKTVIIGSANKELEAMNSRYRIDWTEAFGGTLYNFRETLTAVSGGVTDI